MLDIVFSATSSVRGASTVSGFFRDRVGLGFIDGADPCILAGHFLLVFVRLVQIVLLA